MAKFTTAAILTAAALGVVTAGAVLAQSSDPYPSKPIRLIVPFPPGASTDLAARYIEPKLRDALKQTVIVENRPGAAGILGATFASKAAPDGYTVLVASSSMIAVPQLQKAPAYDIVRDFAPITVMFSHPFVLVANADLPAKNAAELVALAKSKPGVLNFATLGGYNDLMCEMFKKAAGIDIQLVRYRGAAENMIGVIRGDSHLTFTGYSVVQPQLAAGKVRIIGAASLQRSVVTPQLPTLAESGLPGFELLNVVGLLAPAGTPKPIIDRLNAEVGRIMSTDEAKKFLTTRGNDPVSDTSVKFYQDYIKRDSERFRRIVEEIGYQKI